MPDQGGLLGAAQRLQEEERRRVTARGGGRGPTPTRGEAFRPFESLRTLFGGGRTAEGLGYRGEGQPRNIPGGYVNPNYRPPAGGPPPAGPPAGAAGQAAGYTPLLPAVMKTGATVPTRPGAAAGRPAAAIPPPPAAPGTLAARGGGGAAGRAQQQMPAAPPAGAGGGGGGAEAEVDWLELGFGSQQEGEGWARAFAAEHGGNMPWEEGTMSPRQNLAEHLAALQWGQQFQQATGRGPAPGDYRVQWYTGRFGLGPNWSIEGASPGGGRGYIPREYMGG